MNPLLVGKYLVQVANGQVIALILTCFATSDDARVNPALSRAGHNLGDRLTIDKNLQTMPHIENRVHFFEADIP
jgi:hypothetical protein